MTTTQNETEVLRALRSVRSPAGRARLWAIYREVELGRDEAEQALRSLAGRGLVALFPLDDPSERTAADRNAAINLCGVPQHVAYES